MLEPSRRTNRWRLIPSSGEAPCGRIGHTFIGYEGKAFVFGGVNDTLDPRQQYFGDFHAYDTTTKTWAEIPLTGAVQNPRAFHSAVFYNGGMYVFGGCNGRGRFNKLFSVARDGTCRLIVPRTPPPFSRYCHSAVVFGTKMYVFAGKCGGRNSNRRLSDLSAYDFLTNEWQPCLQFGSIPPPRSAHGCFVYGGSMLVFGGRNAEGDCCEDLFEYQFHTGAWRSIDLNCSAFGRARHSVALHNGRIIVFGGWNGKQKLNDLFFFSLDTFCFEMPDEGDTPPSRRECHNATVVNNTMVVFGGRFRGEFMNDVSELELGAKSLKDNCRDWLLENSVPYLNRGLPQLVVAYVKATDDTHKRNQVSASSSATRSINHPRRPVAPGPPTPTSPPSLGVAWGLPHDDGPTATAGTSPFPSPGYSPPQQAGIPFPSHGVPNFQQFPTPQTQLQLPFQPPPLPPGYHSAQHNDSQHSSSEPTTPTTPLQQQQQSDARRKRQNSESQSGLGNGRRGPPPPPPPPPPSAGFA